MIYVADFLLDFLFHPSPLTSSLLLKALQIWKLYSHGGLIFLSRPTESYKSQLSGWISGDYKEKNTGLTRHGGIIIYIFIMKSQSWPASFLPSAGAVWFSLM